MANDLTSFLITPPRRETILAAYREVREGQVRHTTLEEPEAVQGVLRILDSLPGGLEKQLAELRLRSNVKEWIESLFKDVDRRDADRLLGYLLNDFTDSMRSRMRETGKYAVAFLVSDGRLILLHSRYGEEVVTPGWKVYERLIDSDNVLRYVWFTRDGKVRFYERYKTRSFAEWLGLSAREALHYYGARFRIHVDLAGLPAVLELDEDEAARLIEQHPELLEGRISLAQPVSVLPISRVQISRNKSYSSVKEFLKDFYAMRYGLDYYVDRCREILESLTPLLGRLVDDRERVYVADSGETVLEKRVNNIVLVCAVRGLIELSPGFRDWIAYRAANWETVELFHVAEPLAAEPHKAGPFIFYNEVADEAAEVYSSRADSIDSPFLRLLLLYAALKRLAATSPRDTLGYLFEEIALTLKGLVVERIPGSLPVPEGEVLEYKAADYYSRVAANPGQLAEDMAKKLGASPVKLYLIGVADDGSLEGIPASRLRSDIAGKIAVVLSKKLGVWADALPLVYGEKGILVIAVKKQDR